MSISPGTFLEHIERAGLFAVPLDERREWYRYHHLFQELLVSQAEAQLGKAELKATHARASAWFAGQGYVEDAVRHALAADEAVAFGADLDKHLHLG